MKITITTDDGEVLEIMRPITQGGADAGEVLPSDADIRNEEDDERIIREVCAVVEYNLPSAIAAIRNKR